MKLDYLICAREKLHLGELGSRFHWDYFISTFNDSARVQLPFAAVRATNKHWLMAEEYGYKAGEEPSNGKVFWLRSTNEATAISEYLVQSTIDFSSVHFCIDITGFMRAQLLFLMKHLSRLGVKSFDAVYSEPQRYPKKEQTRFSDGAVFEVRQISGFEGSHDPDATHDLLIVAAGYDDELVSRVAGFKDHARMMLVYGLPSLSADMYQESVLRMARARSAVQSRAFESGVAFTSANDPFVTATVLSDICRSAVSKVPITNFYFSPLSTKPQTLGFGLFYLREMQSKAASILFPFTHTYSRDTGEGLATTWLYHVEL